MGEQLSLVFPAPAKPKRARKPKAKAKPVSAPSPCCAAPWRPDGTLWPGADRRCTKPAGHHSADDPHENTRGDVWNARDVLAPCPACDGAGMVDDATCTACEGTGRADEEVCGG